MEKKIAFTLAEVLITLAIIGIVAALTIPSVITNYRKNLYVTQLKKEYNYFTNAFHTAMARDGVTKLSDTKLWTSMPNNYGIPLEVPKLISSDDFKNEFLKVFNVVQIYDEETNKIPVKDNVVMYKSLTGSTTYIDMNYANNGVCLADSACFKFSFLKNPYNSYCGDYMCNSLKEFQENRNTTTKYWQYAGSIYLDVNGFTKGPNQMGRDWFLFSIGNDGNLYPSYGADDAVEGGASYADVVANTTNRYWKYDNNNMCNLTNPNANYSGHGCAARIMEEGWKMNY